MLTATDKEVTPIGRWTRGATTSKFFPKICLVTNEDRAIDLSCRACGAGAGAKTSNSELDFPVGEPSVLLPQPPT